MRECEAERGTQMDASTIYNQYTNVSADTLKTNLQNQNLTNATDDELMDACKQFEQYLVEQMYKAMETTIMKDEDDESSDSYISGMTDYFGDVKVQKYAELVTESGDLGIAQKLYDQLKVNVAGTIPAASAAAAQKTETGTDA